jgi:hypothetical protein
MQTRVFEVGEKRYDVAMASAVKQDELLSILSRHMVIASSVAKQQGTELNENSVLIAVMALPVDVKKKIVDIVTEMAIEVGTTNRVSVKDFTGKMVEWNLFIARLIMWNLSDFFELLSGGELEKMLMGELKNK